ncbi:unnamed protein product [Lota lota]
MAHNNAIVRNKTILQAILSADHQYILSQVREKELITSREYTKLNTINKGDAEDLVIKLVDILHNKGVKRESEFIELLKDEDVLQMFPRLEDVKWEDTESTVSSSSLKRSAERSLSKGKKKKCSTVMFISMDDRYPLTSKPTGLCVIINNENFGKEDDRRRGTEKDVVSLAKVFSWLGFLVLMCKDQTASDMAQVTKLLAALKDLAGLQKCKLEEWSDGRFTPLSVLPRHGDAFVCCVLSHGKEKVVLGVDNVPLPIRDITSAFNGEHCSGLLGKPKVFFIQACQGSRVQLGLVVDDLALERPEEEDGPPVVHIPVEADFLVAMATVEECKAYRVPDSGSLFIQSLCEQLREGCPSKDDLLSTLTRVNREVSKGEYLRHKQMPQPKYTLTKKLVLTEMETVRN